MGDYFQCSFKGNWEEGLDRLTGRLTDDVSRAGAQAMAEEVYTVARRNAPVSDRPRRLKGGRLMMPGTLQKAIYQAYSEDNSKDGRQVYHVSWNRKKAPHGHFAEFGTSTAPAHPFLYPAYAESKGKLVRIAIDAMAAKFRGGS